MTLNQVLVSFGDDAATRRVIAELQADVERSLAAMVRIARRQGSGTRSSE